MMTQMAAYHFPSAKFQALLSSLWWPATISRVPSGVLDGGTLKADQWRNLTTVLPVLLYGAWAVEGQIPDTEAPRPDETTKPGKALAGMEALLHERRCERVARDVHLLPKHLPEGLCPRLRMKRNYRMHFNTVLQWCSSVRIWASRSISPEEVQRAQDCHDRACQTWAEMNCHLMPYFHLSTHHFSRFLALGPSYAWWTYAGERNNGYLGKFRHNGHTGGELESTMMRGWLKSQLIFNLVRCEYACGRD